RHLDVSTFQLHARSSTGVAVPAPASRYNKAIRTATPFVTCASMSERVPCATAGSISIPSFIGPGCITGAPERIRATRSAVRPQTREYSRRDGRSPDAWRSRWIRSAITASAPSSARSRSDSYVTPCGSCPHRHAVGISVGGPASVIRAPSGRSVLMSERATRLCRTSPTMTTRFPSRSPTASRSVYASSTPCVGWACQPSPALITAAAVRSATKYGAPEAAWRITTMSPPKASSVRTVSSKVSPFSTLDPPAVMFVTSAERAFAASSNETRVRVDASAKKRITVLPRSGGALRTGRFRISTIAPVVSRTASISSRDHSVVDREIERGLVNDRRVADARQIVAIQRDVERAERDCPVLMRADRLAQARREHVTTRADTDDRYGRELAVALDDLMSDAGD